MSHRIVVAMNAEDQARRAAREMGERARQAIAARGRFTITLGGGSSVRQPYELLAAEPGIDWKKVFVFWGDERFVSHDHEWSNYRLARESLLDRVPQLPAGNVFPVPTGAATPREGARRYAATIREFFGLAKGEVPRFDLCQNGMGPDGHTASLFPHATTRAQDFVHMAHAGLTPWVDRITMSHAVFNNARCVLFITGGAAKAALLQQVLEGPAKIKHWPASGVAPRDGEVMWLLDPPGASLLAASA